MRLDCTKSKCFTYINLSDLLQREKWAEIRVGFRMACSRGSLGIQPSMTQGLPRWLRGEVQPRTLVLPSQIFAVNFASRIPFTKRR
jgi:hypothetical protein